MDAAVVQVSKPVRNSRHYDSAPVQPLHIEGKANTNIIVNLFDKRLDNKSLFYIKALVLQFNYWQVSSVPREKQLIRLSAEIFYFKNMSEDYRVDRG